MTRVALAMAILTLVVIVIVTPGRPLADHRGPVFGGFTPGAVTGLPGGGVVAPRGHLVVPWHVAHHPGPVFLFGPVHYPAATCWDYWVSGYWFQGTWVPAHWERRCR